MRAAKIAVSSPSFSASPHLMKELSVLGDIVASNAHGRRMSATELAAFLRDSGAEIAIVGLEPVTKSVVAECPVLRIVCKYGVGVDNIDLDSLRDQNIKLGWTGGVNKRSVSELVLAFALGHLRNVYPSVQKMREGIWQKEGGRQLSDVTFGIVGFGNVGQDLASLLVKFGCKVLCTDILDKSAEAARLNAMLTSYDEILKSSDVISFHVPSTSQTKSMFAAPEIDRAKDDALIINTSRGEVIDFKVVCSAVEVGKLGAFASDVFPYEPYEDCSFRHIPNIYFTPHIGGNSREAVLAMGRAAIGHVREYLMESK